MSPQSILAAFFAGFGIYLFACSALSAAASLVALVSFLSVGGFSGGMLVHGLLQAAVGLIPMAVSLALVLCARRCGALAARFAGIAEDAKWEIQVSPVDLLTVLLAGVGAYWVLTEVGPCLRMVVLLFKLRVGSPLVQENAGAYLGDELELVGPVASLVCALLLAKNCRRLAALILREPKTTSRTSGENSGNPQS